jgi:hypothetical protein
MPCMPKDWFVELTGFQEENYDATRRQLVIEGDELVSTVNGERYGIGSLEVPTLAELRSRVEIPLASIHRRDSDGEGCRNEESAL